MNIVFSRKGDVWGHQGVTDGYTIEISWTEEEMAELQAGYDPTSDISPNETLGREVLRAILDKFR
jgi:hypothetical protein